MAGIEPPGNPKGWGDPGPIVMFILFMIFLGAWVDNLSRTAQANEAYCRDLLGLPR